MSRPIPTIPRVTEATFVRAIATWLCGDDWSFEDARFSPYHGLSIRLRADGDTLGLAGVPILSRNPAAIVPASAEHPADNATARSEAQALCDVALRGDEGMYRVLPGKQPLKLAA